MLVSIVITAYNVEPYIRQCVLSAVNQMRTTPKGNTFDLEVIVVDDYSTDDTSQILEELVMDHKDLQVIKSGDCNQGAGMSRRVGITSSKGDYVLLLDGDD